MTAIEDFTNNGDLWSYDDWRSALGRDFEYCGDPQGHDHPQTIGEEGAETNHTSRKGLDEQNTCKG